MTMHWSIEQRRSFLLTTVTGSFDLDSARELSASIVEECAIHGLSKVLTDIRQLRRELSAMTTWDCVLYAVRRAHDSVAGGQLPVIQFAYIMAGDVVMPTDSQHYGQMVSFNWGLDIRSFGTAREALEWLSLDPEGSPDICGSR